MSRYIACRADHARSRPADPAGVPVDPTLRVLAVATLVNTMGNGALMTTSALYFTQVVGLAPTQVGAALAVAAAVALFCQVPLGHLGDVRGPREVLLWLTAAAGVATLGLLVTGRSSGWSWPRGGLQGVPALITHVGSR